LVPNDLAAGGTERARSDYDGWFISPEGGLWFPLRHGRRLHPDADGAGALCRYSETGSAQGLSVGSRTLQNFDESGQKVVSGHVRRQADCVKKPVIQFILIVALQRKTGVPRSGEAANFTAIYQFRIGLQHCGMMADIADWP
jgi:hypothetical protein